MALSFKELMNYILEGNAYGFMELNSLDLKMPLVPFGPVYVDEKTQCGRNRESPPPPANSTFLAARPICFLICFNAPKITSERASALCRKKGVESGITLAMRFRSPKNKVVSSFCRRYNVRNSLPGSR